MGKESLTDRYEVAERIREVREKSGLTQEKFAERLGISLSGYKKIENAENQVSVNVLRKLKQNFQVPADYMLFGAGEGVEAVWERLQGSSDSDRMYLLVRLLYYFMKTRDGTFCTKEEQERIEKTIFHVMDEIKNR